MLMLTMNPCLLLKSRWPAGYQSVKRPTCLAQTNWPLTAETESNTPAHADAKYNRKVESQSQVISNHQTQPVVAHGHFDHFGTGLKLIVVTYCTPSVTAITQTSPDQLKKPIKVTGQVGSKRTFFLYLVVTLVAKTPFLTLLVIRWFNTVRFGNVNTDVSSLTGVFPFNRLLPRNIGSPGGIWLSLITLAAR